MKLKLTEIDFDLSSDDVEENVDFATLQRQLRNKCVGKVFDVEHEDEIADVISDQTGWCINWLNYKIISR
jgi:hypothetical protein